MELVNACFILPFPKGIAISSSLWLVPASMVYGIRVIWSFVRVKTLRSKGIDPKGTKMMRRLTVGRAQGGDLMRVPFLKVLFFGGLLWEDILRAFTGHIWYMHFLETMFFFPVVWHGFLKYVLQLLLNVVSFNTGGGNGVGPRSFRATVEIGIGTHCGRLKWPGPDPTVWGEPADPGCVGSPWHLLAWMESCPVHVRHLRVGAMERLGWKGHGEKR